jgi:sulfotransferase
MTSPVGSLFSNLVASVSAGSELAPMVSADQRARLSLGLFESYYADLGLEIETVFDTNRMWTANLGALSQLFPEGKVIACVRDVAWIMDSLERQYQSTVFENTRLFTDPSQRSSVYTRCETWANRNGLVGHAWSALSEAVFGSYANRLLLVDYDLLAARPGEVIKLIYDFLEIKSFNHDYDNVVYDAPVFDEQLGTPGLHKVHKKVAPMPRKTILPPELFEQYGKLNFWPNLKGSGAKMIIQQNSE